ncbi:hypothetical protein B0I35DRAFT_431157 [Stachybotrys elegans]|uniref:Geranylgeranyl transferase type-2 subunit alpha n=1 Tax=Stachybotrys elegans TaxID=80388 RepID=A0A8K0WTG5_9HYPO|nr:hypothetical protein B0I35DRAFT_431157 [Stachybotrys elegans]
MESHGVARVRRIRSEKQRQQDLEKIDKYRALEGQLRQQIADSLFNPDTFDLTTKLLRINPEYYTIWNVRRRCLISGLLSKPLAGSLPSTESPNSSANAIPTTSSAESLPSSSTATLPDPGHPTTGTSGTTPDVSTQDRDTLRAELGFTVPLLIEHPKCYWIWNYRLWILAEAVDRLPTTEARRIWLEELGLVGKMLQKDQRNYHAWAYRRNVVAKLESPALQGESMVESEFAQTTSMIRGNLSNFSAWHSRSQLIPRLLEERKADHAARQKFLDQELDQIRNALNVDPTDQSLWFYHQYLMLNLIEQPEKMAIAPELSVAERESYLLREIEEIVDLLDDYQDTKWIYEALVEYTVALGKIHSRDPNAEELNKVASWLQSLRALDPKRNGRWSDLETQLGLKP